MKSVQFMWKFKFTKNETETRKKNLKKNDNNKKKAVSTVCGGEVTIIKGKSNFLVNKVVVDIFFDHQTFRRIPVTVIYAKRNWLIMM